MSARLTRMATRVCDGCMSISIQDMVSNKVIMNNRTPLSLPWRFVCLIVDYSKFMCQVNKLTTSFKLTNALDIGKNQDEYNINVWMLDEEELN